MAQVNVTINDQVFRVGCEEGQEETLIALAEDLNRRIDGFRASFGDVGNMRLLIMAALEVGDELDDVRRRLAATEAEVDRLREAGESVEDRVAAAQQALAESLDSATSRIEQLTADLNGNSRQ